MRLSSGRAVALMVAGMIAPGVLAAAGPPGIQAMPGEVVLTEVEQTEALRGTDRTERTRLAELFDREGAILPVAYTRALFQVDVGPDGEARITEVGRREPRPGSGLRLPDVRIAAASGSTARYDLYASIGIGRLGGPGYRWVVASYFRWNGSNGMDPCNRAEDSIATSWAGGLSLYQDASYGSYHPYAGSVNPLDIYRSDVSGNSGVGWSFHELKQRNSQVCTSANWGEGDAYISEPAWQSRTSNVVMKYVHTRGTGSYSLGFSIPGGIGTSISVSPPDSNQWATAAYATFSH